MSIIIETVVNWNANLDSDGFLHNHSKPINYIKLV